jgi:hypothetical protein
MSLEMPRMKHPSPAWPAARRALVVLGALAATMGCGPDTPPPPPGEVAVPMRMLVMQDDTALFVPVMVNNQGPFYFVLDTGASSSVVNRRLARRLKLHRTGETDLMRGVTGEAEVSIVTVDRWSVGGRLLHGHALPALNLRMGGPGLGPVGGLLGADELRRFGVVSIDFRHKQLRLPAP